MLTNWETRLLLVIKIQHFHLFSPGMVFLGNGFQFEIRVQNLMRQDFPMDIPYEKM